MNVRYKNIILPDRRERDSQLFIIGRFISPARGETQQRKEVPVLTLIDNDTQDEIIDLVVFGFTLAIIVGVLGFVIGRFSRR